ncbi:MAG: hypothetical protein RL038_93 [Actinomycetota bacterium]
MGVDRKRVPNHLHDRYDIRPRPIAAWVVSGVVFAAVVLGGLWQIGDRLVSGGRTALVGWQELSPTSVSLVWSINRPDAEAVYCVARVQDADRFDVGYAAFWISETGPTATYRLVVNTVGDNFSVPNPVCEPSGFENLPGPHFRPGILPPAQSQNLAAPWQVTPAPIDK